MVISCRTLRLLGSMLSRHFCIIAKRSASTAAKSHGAVSGVEEKVSRLPNGLIVASVDLRGAVSQLCLAFRAGSRYEQPSEAGLVHHLRNVIGTDSNSYLGAQMLWQCGSAGANLVSSVTRDFFAVQMSIIRDHASIGLSLLGELSQPAFKPWDVEERVETLYADRAYLQPYDILMDKLHHAAYRNGPLGNALYSKRSKFGKIKFDQLAKFAASRFVSGEAALVGVNVDHNQIISYAAEQLTLPNGKGQKTRSSPYFGGEIHHLSVEKFAHVAIVGQGAHLGMCTKDKAVQAVMSAALCHGQSTEFSNTAGNGIIEQALYKASSGYPFGVSAINELHSDSGLFGIYLVAGGEHVTPLVDAAVKTLKSFSIPVEALHKAKSIARTSVLTRAESSFDVAFDRAAQLLVSDQAVSPAELVNEIDKVTVEDVLKALRTMTSKLTIVSHGNISQVPYLDEL
ncbi:hypothetical protein AB6A40_007395 [Gnathostoma spinigerum]|uniref:Uncharacterized protein n=1 Tax=Gnathostoma spinigerum TaxID=75299 RepID=A0ABD6EN35_9BILA